MTTIHCSLLQRDALAFEFCCNGNQSTSLTTFFSELSIMAPSARKTAATKAGNSTPTKASNGANAKPRSSPAKGRRNKKAIKQVKPLEPGWCLRCTLYEGCIMGIQITTSNLTNDACFQPLVEKLLTDDEDEINQIGLLVGAYYMRVSLTNGNPLLNSGNGYQRRAFVCVLDEDEANSAAMLSKLQVVKRFLEQPENNRYGTKVFIREPGWDLTPPEPAPLPKLDHTFQFREIKRILESLFDDVGPDWAVSNRESADCFFTAGHIPFQAVADLGFPLDAVVPNEPGVVS